MADQAKKIENDAAGQFVRTRHGAENDGLSSAEPRVISGDGDATFEDDPGFPPESRNDRQTGARKLQSVEGGGMETGPDERTNDEAPEHGLQEDMDDVPEKTRHGDGRNPPGSFGVSDARSSARRDR
jgi:hypothetical protein